MNISSKFGLLLTASTLAALVSPARAQDAGAQPSNQTTAATPDINKTAADPVSSDASSDIVVTAQRREQRLQEAPVAVTALSERSLDQLNVTNTQALMTVVPSLQVSTQAGGDAGGSATFFLRGMGQMRAGNGSEPAVGIYVDDFYYPSLSGTIFQVVDLASVEVLRGPQGTLFGRNTIGGAIRYTTRGAELGKFSGHVTGTVGNRNHYDVSGGLNLPIGDFAAFRITGGHLEQDGFVRNQNTGKTVGGSTTDLIRLQARIEPTSNIYVDLSGQYSRFNLDGFNYNVPGPLTPVPPAPGAGPTLPFIWNAVIAPVISAPLYTNAFRSSCYYCQYGGQYPEFSTTKYKNALATVGWTITPGLTLKSLTGWQEVENRSSSDLDSTPLPIFQGGLLLITTRAFSQELQLNGKLWDDRLNFVAGGYYYNERNPGLTPERPNVVLGNPSPNTPTTRNLKSYAGFVDGSFKLTGTLSLLGGFRYSEDHKSVLVTNGAGTTLASASRTFTSKTFRAGVQQQWTPDIMTYANVSTGFRGGGFNPYNPALTPNLIPFEPEKATSYEVGARLQFLDRRITINPTAFYVDWSNIQIQSAEPNRITGNVDLILQNAAKARSYGFEVEYSVGLTDALRLFGNVAYLNLRYLDTGTAKGITINSDFQRAPPFTFAIGGAHTLRLDSGAQIVSTVNYSFQDDQKSTGADNDALLLRAYGLLNGRIEFTDAGKRFSLAAYMNNILDKRYTVGGVNYYANVGAAHYDLGTPREFGLTGRFNF